MHGKSVSKGRGQNIGNGNSTYNGPSSSSQWMLTEARQVIQSTFWELI